MGYEFYNILGYLLGFIIGTFVTGLIAYKKNNPSIKRLLVANFSGLFIVYLVGMIYYYVIKNFYLGSTIGVWTLFLYCFLLAVPGDIVICIVCSFLGKRLIPVIGKDKRK